MCAKPVFIVFVLLIIVKLSSAIKDEKENSRKSRFLSFNTLENDITVDLDFSIPFITIPVKKTADSSFGLSDWDLPLVNVNMASLVLGGIVVLGSTVFLPHLLKGYAYQNPQERYSRLIDNTEFKTEVVLDFMSQMLKNDGIQGCALRVACWTAQRHSGADSLRMWNQVKRNELVSTLVNSTAVEEAMVSGNNGYDCTTYTPCPLRADHVPFLLTNIAELMKRFSESK